MAKLWRPFSRFDPAYLPLLLPVAPPGARMGAKSRIQPGKVPTLYNSARRYWHGYPWTKVRFTPEDHERMASWPECNVGIRCGDPEVPLLCLDFDVEFDVGPTIEHLQLLYGPIPEQRRGPFRRKLIFRVRMASAGFNRTLHFTGPDGQGRHGLDVLFADRQFVADGLHPSGQDYEWVEGRDLRQMPPERLPLVEDVEALVGDALAALEAQGCQKILEATTTADKAERHSLPCPDLEAPQALVESWVRAIPNDEPWHHWDGFVRMAHALKAASGGEAWGLELFHEWAGQWAEGYDPELVDGRWDSVKTSSLGAEYLYHLACERGWDRANPELDLEARSYLHSGIAMLLDDVPGAEPSPEPDPWDDLVAPERPELLLEQWVYAQQLDQYVHLPTRRIYPAQVLNNTFRKFYPGGRKPNAVSVLARKGRTVEGVDYLPGQSDILPASPAQNRGPRVNLWRPPTLAKLPETPPGESEVAPWLEVLTRVTPDTETRTLLLDYMTLLVQRPDIRPNWAIVMLGGQGIGKDSVWEPVRHAVGPFNCTTLSGDLIEQPYTGYMQHAHLAFVEEVKGLSPKALNKLKAMITTPPNTLTINPKFGRMFEISKSTVLVLFTNDSEALPLEEGDRRFFVVEGRGRPDGLSDEEDRRFWEEFHTWLAAGGNDAVAAFLRTRTMQTPISRFLGHAPKTAAKQAMVEAARDPLLVWLEEEVSEGELPDLVLLAELAQRARAARVGSGTPSCQQLAKHAKFLGWKQVNRGTKLKLRDGRAVRVWSVRRHELYAAMAPADLVERLHRQQANGMGLLETGAAAD